jgi:sulfonate dioxygenase
VSRRWRCAAPHASLTARSPYHNPLEVTETEADAVYPYPHLKPCFPDDINTAPYTPIHNFVDRGTHADPQMRSLLADAKLQHLTVNIGSELSGLQVKSLTPAQRDELALLVAQRCVVVLRDQDLTPDELVEFGRYFGAPERPLHQHPSSGVPRTRKHDDVHVVWHDENMKPSDLAYTATELYHSDVSFELNPPGLTALYNITNPVHGGGDTLFSSGYGLYDALSEPMRAYCESLYAVHSGVAQAEGASKAGLHLRRPAIETVHPLVRTNPVTGWKSIYANPAFTTRIEGVPRAESEMILAHLYGLMTTSPQLTLRVRWEKGTIAIWNNATCNHSATYDHWRPDPSCRRHALRVAATAEIPSLTLPDGSEGRSRQEDIWEEQGLDVAGMKERAKQRPTGGFKD